MQHQFAVNDTHRKYVHILYQFAVAFVENKFIFAGMLWILCQNRIITDTIFICELLIAKSKMYGLTHDAIFLNAYSMALLKHSIRATAEQIDTLSGRHYLKFIIFVYLKRKTSLTHLQLNAQYNIQSVWCTVHIEHKQP